MACNYNKIEYPLSKISDLEKLRVDIIDALNEVGVACDASTSFHDLPDYILKIGGTNTSNWPLDLSSIGYNANDCRTASYRYMLSCLRDENSNQRSYLNLSNLINTAINTEIPKSRIIANMWNSYPSSYKATKEMMFYNWDGAFCPMIDTTDARTMTNWFNGASKLVYVPLLNTANVTRFGGVFANNTHNLLEWPEFDLRSVDAAESIYYNGTGYAYICGFKNFGRDPSTGTLNQIDSIYADFMFFAVNAGAWWYPCHGGILVHPMWFYKPGRGDLAVFYMNILSCDALYYYDTDLNIQSSTDISYNALYNIITSIADVSNDPDVTWTPKFRIKTSVHNNSDVWDPTFDRMLQDKGWAIEITN